MPRKPARMYTQIRGQCYTRREYMGGVPHHRIAQFKVGTAGDYKVQVSLCIEENCQIRSTSLEAARIAINRILNKHVGPANFFFRIRVYPHNVLRENKQATGAGADRVSDGMRKSFGKPIGTAARVSKGQAILTIWVQPQHFEHAKKALWKARMKLPAPSRVVIEKGEELLS
ncbi:MAG: 50S ribosomal protein L16 [Candidatus Thermoplasmatota archaeon]|nr:50S ribosomal protein L16 [Candidatus Thermoplasmatota archaeon]